MRQTFACCVFLLTLFFVSPVLIKACSCVGSTPPCQAFWNTDAVFSGQVTEIKDASVKSAPKTDDGRSFSFPKRTVRFAVKESFRGTDEKVIELETGAGGGDCGYAFETGQSYLVYAYRDSETGKMSSNICTRTQLLSKATEDLEYFRGLKDAKAGGTVYGQVIKHLVRKQDDEYKPNPPLENITLTFLGNGNTYEATTDADGKYRISGLPAGEYKMNIAVPEEMWGFEKEQTIKVPDKGCAVTFNALSTKTFLGGKIQNADGAPLKDFIVNLVPVDQINERYQKDVQFAYTDEQGRYLFKEAPAGTYYLGVQLSRINETNSPYPRTFYPGTTELQDAVPVTIIEGKVIENFDFTLGKKLAPRKVSGTVVMPDGKPVAKAFVCVEEVEYAESSVCRDGIETDDKGQFLFNLPNNLRYLIRSHVNIQNNQQRHAEPIEVAANGDVSNVKLVISEPNGSCEKCRMWKRSKN